MSLPAIIFGLIFIGFLTALVFRTVIGWYIDGAASLITCALMLGTNVALFVGILIIPSMVVKGSIVLLQVATLLLTPVIGQSLSDRNHSGLDNEKMESYRRAIARDPKNLAARTKLSELLYQRNLLDDAIEELSIVVRAQPDSFADAHRLKRMMEEREERKAPPVKCPSCGHSNPSGRSRCSNCGSGLSVGRLYCEWLVRGGLRQIVVVSTATMLGLAIILTFFSMLSLIGKVAIVSLTLLIVISAEYLYIHRNW